MFCMSTVGALFSFIRSAHPRDTSRVCLGKKHECVSTITHRTCASDNAVRTQWVLKDTCSICSTKMQQAREALLGANAGFATTQTGYSLYCARGLTFILRTDICSNTAQ